MLSAKYSTSLALAVLLMASEFVVAQEVIPRNAPVRSGPRQNMPNKYLVIPGLEPLSLESVQQEINLAPEQKQQLKQISDVFLAEIREQQTNMQNEMKAMRDRPEEEQEKRAAVLEQRMNQLAQGTRRKADAVLSREQSAEIHEIAFRLYVAATLTSPSTQQQLALDARQQQQLMSIYEQSTEQLHKVQRQTASQLLKTLTPEQQAELRRQMENPQPRRQ